MVTSFSSKSEIAMGYTAPINAVDVSNSNTPGVVDPTNPVRQNAYRAVALIDQHGKIRFTENQCL